MQEVRLLSRDAPRSSAHDTARHSRTYRTGAQTSTARVSMIVFEKSSLVRIGTYLNVSERIGTPHETLAQLNISEHLTPFRRRVPTCTVHCN